MAKKTKPVVENVKVQEPQVKMHDVFAIVKVGNNYMIGCGNNYMSKATFASIKDAQEYIDSKPWELIINTTCYIYELSKQNKK